MCAIAWNCLLLTSVPGDKSRSILRVFNLSGSTMPLVRTLTNCN